MIAAPLHPDEQARLASLRSYGILDSEEDARFQLLVEQASAICGVPVSLISLVDEDRQWFKARVGVDAVELPRALSFCGHAILNAGVFEVPDARLDQRFHDNPLVNGPSQLVFYAGAPINGRDGLPLGTICAVDKVPRTLDDAQRSALQLLARQAEVLLEARQRTRPRTVAPSPAGDPHESPARSQAVDAQPPASGGEQPIARLVRSGAWSSSGEVIAESLADFFQMPIRGRQDSDGVDTARVATMVQLDTVNETALTVNLVIEVSFLRSFAARLFGRTPDGQSEQAILFETANIVTGAVKRAFEAEGFRSTTGLPRECTAQAAQQELSQAGAAKQHLFEVEGQRVSLSLGLQLRPNRRVAVSQLTEGMVLVGDLCGPRGEVLVAHGTRLTLHSIARIVDSSGADTVAVGGAIFV